MSFDLNNTWFGVGVKTGGMLLIVGVEGVVGKIANLAQISKRANFDLLNARMGVGLGGGGNLVAICAFNTISSRQLHGMSNDDWGISLSIGGRWKEVAKTFSKYKFYSTVANIGTKLNFGSPEQLEKIRDCLHVIYNEYEIAKMSNTPKVVIFDTPLGGGLEASATYSFGGRIEIH